MASATVVTACVGIGGCGEAVDAPSKVTGGSTVLSTLPVGDDGIGYANADVVDALSWGPPGVYAVRDGFVIPDNVRRRLLELDVGGHVLRDTDVSNVAIGIVDLVDDGAKIVALDKGSTTPTLLFFDRNLAYQSSAPLPVEWSEVTGIITDDLGVIVQLDGGQRLARVERRAPGLALTPIAALVWGGTPVQLDPAADTPTMRLLHIGDAVARLSAPHRLGHVEPLASDGEGGVFVWLEDVQMASAIQVDEEVWHVDHGGHVLGHTHIPNELRSIGLEKGVTVTPAGVVVSLVPRSTEVELRAHDFAPGAPSPVDTAQNPSAIGQTSDALISGNCSQASIVANANEYIANATSIGTKSIVNDASCPTRYVPHYLGGPATQVSVSYDWGGFDTPASFNAAMGASHKAGNLNTAAVLSCAYGVDCSGFVSRAWGLTTKQSTTTLASTAISSPVDLNSLKAGDALDLPGSHVVLFDTTSGAGGIMDWESTAYQNFDRVVHTYRPWSTLSGYKGYRSKSACYGQCAGAQNTNASRPLSPSCDTQGNNCNFTPPFSASTSCACSGGNPSCHALYRGAVRSIAPDGWHADMAFTKADGTTINAGTKYWIVVGQATPNCSDVPNYVVRLGPQTVPLTQKVLIVPDVPLWPAAGQMGNYATAPVGDTKNIFIITDGSGSPGQKTWFEAEAVTFTKACP